MLHLRFLLRKLKPRPERKLAGAAFVNVALDGQDAEAVCRVEKKLHVPLEKVRKVLKIAKEPL
jgi:hypothetical protein